MPTPYPNEQMHVFEASCVKRDGAWQVERVAFRSHPAEPAGGSER